MSKAVDGLGSNIPKQPAAPPLDVTGLLASMKELRDQNLALLARVEKAEAATFINTPDNETADELFPRMAAQPVKRMQIKRVWIILEENENIPRNGQIFGANGMTYLLKPGVRAHVPVTIIDILNHAIEGKPVVKPETLQIEYYVQRLRYPYRMVGPPRGGDDQLFPERGRGSIYQEAAA